MFYTLTKFYHLHLPFWNALIEENLKDQIATWTLDPVEQAERVEGYFPLLIVFTLSFSQKLLAQNPRLLRAAARMEPEAYATDADYRLRRKMTTFENIIGRHLEGIRAFWEALNVYGYFLEAAENEYVGHETAKIAFGHRRPKLEKLESILSKRIGDRYEKQDIRSAVGMTLAELLDKSGKKTPITDAWEIPENRLGKQIRQILRAFDGKTGQAQDAISGKHRIATKRAISWLPDYKRQVEFLVDTEDPRPEHGLFIDLNRLSPRLTKNQHRVLKLILRDPDISNREIAQELGIDRKTVYNTLKALRKRLPDYL
ncbi:MAG: winged helix-turn-helix transcriptional regulator [Desulfobacteraceae bacterium]